MKRFLMMVALLLGILHGGAASTDSRLAAARQETDEKVRRLQAELEDTKALVSALSKKLEAMSRQVKSQSEVLRRLSDSIRSSQSGNARQNELDALAKSVREIEKNRRADQGQVEKGFKDLRKLILEMSSISRSVPTPPRPSQSPSPSAGARGKYHVVEKGQTLTAIMSAYIGVLKSDGNGFKLTLKKLMKANPGLKPDKLIVGQKIFIPLED